MIVFSFDNSSCIKGRRRQAPRNGEKRPIILLLFKTEFDSYVHCAFHSRPGSPLLAVSSEKQQSRSIWLRGGALHRTYSRHLGGLIEYLKDPGLHGENMEEE